MNKCEDYKIDCSDCPIKDICHTYEQYDIGNILLEVYDSGVKQGQADAAYRFSVTDIYTKKVMCKCFNCNSVSMEKVLIDYDSIDADMQMKYNDGFNDGYKKAKEELKTKLDL